MRFHSNASVRAAAEWIEHHVVFIAAGFKDSPQQRQRLLCRIANTLFGLRIDRRNIEPNVAYCLAGHFVKKTLESRHFACRVNTPLLEQLQHLFLGKLPGFSDAAKLVYRTPSTGWIEVVKGE